MNFFTDNADLQHLFKNGIAWDGFVPLWERGFSDPEGPKNTAEARELYQASLTEIGAFAAAEIAPRAQAIDDEGVGFAGGEVSHPKGLLDNIEGLRCLGAMAVNLPREHGGFNFPMTVGVAVTELIGRACTNTMLLHAFYQGPALMVLRGGSAEQIQRWVRPLAEGRISGAVAMTEPDAGSDVGNLSTTASLEDGVWRVSGRKQFITNGCGDMCLVLARSESGSKGTDGLSMLVVPRALDGRRNYVVAKPEKKSTIRGSATCELAFDGSVSELLGARGSGFSQILTFMNEARVAVAVQGLGLSQAALAAAQSYAERRVQMGRPIARHELVADLLLDMRAELAAMRALVYRCSELQDRILGLERSGAADAKQVAALKRELRDRTPLVKWFGAERTLWITRAAVQVHGGYGVVREYEVERHYRNALILPIYEGTSQIQALMSLKDQVKWSIGKPWSLAAGAVRVEAPEDTLGDALREMADEYNRALRFALVESTGALALVRAALGGPAPDRERLGYALLSAERLCTMLAYARAAEALAATATGFPERRRLVERFVHRSLPLVKMHGEIVRGGDRSTLEAISR